MRRLLGRLPELDYVFDVREPDGFLAKLQALHAPNLDGPVTVPASDRLSAYVAVMGGCNEMCTYCIVPFVRGRELSRPLPEVVEHVERLVSQGVREVTLLGQNVNSYHDTEHRARLPELLAAVDAVPGLWRLRFLTSHPRNAVPELFSAMRDLPTVCEQLHLPVQAGDDNLLRRMRRLYSVDEYRAKIEAAVDAVGPRLALSTDIIVGFCGETEAEFAGTETADARSALRHRPPCRVLGATRDGRSPPRGRRAVALEEGAAQPSPRRAAGDRRGA